MGLPQETLCWSVISIQSPLGYEPSTLTTAPLRTCRPNLETPLLQPRSCSRPLGARLVEWPGRPGLRVSNGRKVTWWAMESWGSWCSGITPAQYAGGPGLNPRTVHITTLSSLAYIRGGPSHEEPSSCLPSGRATVCAHAYACPAAGALAGSPNPSA